ncbi:hypothetical protein C2G38_2214703 [Gigaspora rosea]|uniref:Uncharacterized protein n=1 Tax=Gigaspora rosea TaxID=44941 RepID=A0A397UDV3_9GLOM|nr:hypothetical protein C2G38_2214703 [Gigaspora rosea]
MAIQINSVSKNEIPEHIDEHYCLQIVKGAKQFASAFASYSLIILQNDKAKVPLGIPAVGRTFKTIQTARKPVEVPNHDFPKGSKQKLIPSVYLTIDPEDSNDSLRNGQLSIFIRPQWLLKTSSLTHMVDLMQIVENPILSSKLKLENEFKPILVLLVDGSPDENPRHLKNIKEYCKLFIELNLDYFTIRTHAPGQSAYNPVERSMSTLSGKLAGIVLPIDNFGSHLDSNGVINNVVIEQVIRNLDKTIIDNQINNYLQTLLQPLPYLSLSSTSYSARLNKTSSLSSMPLLAISNSINSLSSMLHSVISSEISSSTIETETPYYNATAQKNSLAKQKDAEK